jgi:hypothetical protein
MQSCMPFSEACIALNQNGSARRKRILPLLCANGHLGLKPNEPKQRKRKYCDATQWASVPAQLRSSSEA